MSDNDEVTRSPRNGVMIAVIGAVAVVLAAAVPATIGLLGKDTGHPRPQPSAAACPGPADPVSHGQIIPDVPGGIAPLQLTAFDYNLAYGKTSAPFMYLEATGKISGQVPPGQDLYPFEWADPTTVDSTPKHHHGSAMYLWRNHDEIIPNLHGCWILPQQPLGYSGAQGLTFRFYLGLLPRTQTTCLQTLQATTAERANGLTRDALASCDVQFIAYAIIPTQPA